MRWLAVLLLVAPLTGCAALAADDGRVRVTAGFYPLAWVAERVGGADVEVVSLTDPGVEPHDIEPTFARTVALARADLVVVEHGFQPAIDEAVEQNAEGQVLDVTDVVDLRHAERRARRTSTATSTTTTTATSTRTSGSTPRCSPTSATPWPPTSPRSTRSTLRRTPPTRGPCAATWPSSTRPSPAAWPTASGTSSSPATTRSATGPSTGSRSRRSPV